MEEGSPEPPISARVTDCTPISQQGGRPSPVHTVGRFHTMEKRKSKATGAVPQGEAEPGTVWGVGQAEGDRVCMNMCPQA